MVRTRARSRWLEHHVGPEAAQLGAEALLRLERDGGERGGDARAHRRGEHDEGEPRRVDAHRAAEQPEQHRAAV
jgi:hypothetical protein